MPTRASRPCSFPRCPDFAVQDGRCRSHARQQREAYDAQRGTAKERGYDATWRRVRRLYLRSHPNCERCMEEKRMVTADLVHHRDRNPRNNDPANLEALCYRHHELEHAVERAWSA